jgi:hypothetical protein
MDAARYLGIVCSLPLTLACVTSGGANAGSANHLLVTNNHCAIQPCPGSPPVSMAVQAGQPFTLFVIAADAVSFDPSYRGTVSFASTDPAAMIPTSYTFVAADAGRKAFPAVFRSPGPQTITVTDSTGMKPGSLTLTVKGSFAGIPSLEPSSQLLLVLLLGSIGLWCLGWSRQE